MSTCIYWADGKSQRLECKVIQRQAIALLRQDHGVSQLSELCVYPQTQNSPQLSTWGLVEIVKVFLTRKFWIRLHTQLGLIKTGCLVRL